MVNEAQDGAHFVEVGVYFGRSTCYMTSRILASGKLITFDAVDWFRDETVELPIHREISKQFGGQLQACRHFLIAAGVDHAVTLLPMASCEAAKLYAKESLDFVWLAGGPGKWDIDSDLAAWYPLLKRTGIIGGPGKLPGATETQRIVQHFFREAQGSLRLTEHSWVHLPRGKTWT